MGISNNPAGRGGSLLNVNEAFVFVFSVSLLVSCNTGKDVIHPERRDLTEAVYASGKIYPKNDYKVFSKLPGYVEEIHVRAGDTVKIGQPLITIRSEISAINVETAKNQLALAQKNAAENGPLLSSLQQEVNSAHSRYELDSVNYQRWSNLYKQNAASQLQVDQAGVQLEGSRAAYTRAKGNYISTRDRLQTERANAELQFEAQSSNRSDYVITAAVHGMVYDVIPKKGELVSSQMPLLEIGNATNFEVELSIDETDIALIKTGQVIVYAIDAYKGIEFTGNVEQEYLRISPVNKTSKVIGTVTIPATMKVYSGMSVEANIVISEKKNVLVIPREYLLAGDLVNIKGKDDPVKVTTGAADLRYVEITAGLAETDELVKE
ncbi:MAG TPA: efflux RND transporter periplasmic adaptor subunit [Bacteroidia bacterium]|nr:efflux RND transporter periplasmic adaptor subunit [Bacteroidia bacterium]